MRHADVKGRRCHANWTLKFVRLWNRKRQTTRRKAINYEKGNWNPSGNGKVIKCNSDCKMSAVAATVGPFQTRAISKLRFYISQVSSILFNSKYCSHFALVFCRSLIILHLELRRFGIVFNLGFTMNTLL